MIQIPRHLVPTRPPKLGNKPRWKAAKTPNGTTFTELHADYKSLPKQRFRWSRLRTEWGRECYRVDSCGTTRATWWEWEA